MLANKRLWKKGICIAVIVVLIFLLGYGLQKPILLWIYPKHYQEYVQQYAVEYAIEEPLIYAVIKAESNFDSNAKSHSEAYGLMQILESTAVEVANEMGEQELETDTLYNPQKNVQIGTAYMRKLLDCYQGNYVLALAAYNAGIGNVTNWIEQGILAEDGSNPEDIPFKETNMYVRNILRDYQIYKELYF